MKMGGAPGDGGALITYVVDVWIIIVVTCSTGTDEINGHYDDGADGDGFGIT